MMRHVLVVDEPAVCAKIETALAPRFRVSQARDGERAMKLLAGDRPDLVLLEAALPGMSGVELAAHVVERGLPAILLTQVPTICTRLERLGWPYLRKPFEIDALLFVIHENLLLARQRQHVIRQSLQHFARVSGELRETIEQLLKLRLRLEETLARSRRVSGPHKPN